MKPDIINLDADDLSCNPSTSKEDLTRVKWQRDCDCEAIPRQHAIVYSTIFSSATVDISVPRPDD